MKEKKSTGALSDLVAHQPAKIQTRRLVAKNQMVPPNHHTQPPLLLFIDLFLFGLSALTSLSLASSSHTPDALPSTSSPPARPRRMIGGAEAGLRRRLKEGTTLDASERVCTVSECNVPTPRGHPRSEVRLNNLWHRATYMIIRHEPSSAGGTGTEEPRAGDADDTTYLLVQRRSSKKDYCPSTLDPAPGGVVGYGESCDDNARRELMEEMGIDAALVGTGAADGGAGEGNGRADGGGSGQSTMRRLITFPYEDDRVRCWGTLYEVTYRGRLDDIAAQEDEVDEVLRLSLADVERRLADDGPDEWMPDGLHALRLYLQHEHDRRLFRRSSSLDPDAYRLRPKPRAVFFDCDDCLYFDGWRIANRLTEKIERWCVERRGLPPGRAYELYKSHGTALRGLLAEGHLENCERSIDEYLREVHDVGVRSMLRRDVALRDMISTMDPTVPRYVFTASVRHHAERCLDALGLSDLFHDIIDTKTCGFATKHSGEAFRAAMDVAGVDDPECCLLLDDSVRNVRAAGEVGWRSVLVGRVGRDCGTAISADGHAEHEIDRIHDLPDVFPELFDV